MYGNEAAAVPSGWQWNVRAFHEVWHNRIKDSLAIRGREPQLQLGRAPEKTRNVCINVADESLELRVVFKGADQEILVGLAHQALRLPGFPRHMRPHDGRVRN